MAEPAAWTMNSAEFLLWQERQAELYELVRGIPVPRSMTGATQRHDLVVINAIAAFRAKLRGGDCRPTTADVSVPIPGGNIRRPDVAIDCGPLDPSSVQVSRPVLVLEVLSPSTAQFDQLAELEEYKTVASIEYILIADSGTPHVIVYRHDGHGAWTSMSHIGVESILDLPKLGCTLGLGELYEDLPAAPDGPAQR